MARSVTGLFMDQRHVDRFRGALIDAGFDAAQISVATPDGLVSALGDGATGDAPPATGRGIGAWLRRHLEGRGLAPEHAERYQAAVAAGRHLVSVAVDTDAQDEEARSLMVDTGAEEISSAADGMMRPVHRADTPGGRALTH